MRARTRRRSRTLLNACPKPNLYVYTPVLLKFSLTPVVSDAKAYLLAPTFRPPNTLGEGMPSCPSPF